MKDCFWICDPEDNEAFCVFKSRVKSRIVHCPFLKDEREDCPSYKEFYYDDDENYED